MRKIFYFLLMLVNSESIKTPFHTIQEGINFVKSPKYFKSVENYNTNDASNYVYDPGLDTGKDTVQYPQKVSYEMKPKIKNIPIYLPSLSFKECWNTGDETNTLLVDIENRMMSFRVKYCFIRQDDGIYLELKSGWIKKNLTPDFVLKQIVQQMTVQLEFILNQ